MTLVAFLSLILTIIVVANCEDFKNDTIRIGVRTKSAAHPVAFVVSLQEKTGGYYKHLCGGTIIDEEFVITAAHCVLKPKRIDKRNLYVVGGSTEIFSKNSIRFRVIDISTHEKFKILKGYDIVLLRVFPKFPLDNKRFSKVSVEDSSKRGTGLNAVLLGWGRVNTKFNKPKPLESVTFRTIDNSACKSQYRFKYLTDTEICAIHSDKGPRGACDGDSGSPLVDENKKILYGILSYGRKACQVLKPYAFSRISTHANWIRQEMTKLMEKSSEKGKN